MQGKRAPRPRNEAQIATLKDFKGRGMSAKDIADSGILPQSLNAIQKKMGRMHLVQHLKIVKFNERQREEIIKATATSPSELAELLKASRAIVMRRRARLGRDLWTGMPLSENELAVGED